MTETVVYKAFEGRRTLEVVVVRAVVLALIVVVAAYVVGELVVYCVEIAADKDIAVEYLFESVVLD